MHAFSIRYISVVILVTSLFLPGRAAAQNQTNDPLVDQQQYLFDVHRVDQAWSYTTGSSNVTIGLYSETGFIQNHEDLSSGRLAPPVGSLLDPEVDIASEMAGIAGAATNNGVGLAGIDRSASLQSYSVLTKSKTCLSDSRCNAQEDEEEPVTFQRPDGTQETYYLNLYRYSDQVNQGRSTGVDVHLFSFGIPSGNPADYDLETPEDPSPTMDPSDHTPGPLDPFEELRDALNTAKEQIGNAICGGWFGSCTSPPDPADLFRDEIGFAVAKDGGVVVTPAGNLNGNGDMPPEYLPGMFDPYAVTVGGIVGNEPDQLQAWNHTRPASYVDVSAFAEDVVGVSGAGSSQYNSNFTSTAASASIGAGVAGLLKAEMPVLTGEDIEEILKRTAREVGSPGRDDHTGTGAIDAEAALDFIRNNDVQRSTQSVESVISDEVVRTEVELRGNGYWDYSSTNYHLVKGDLHKFEAKVPYTQTFRSSPDAWVRWGGSDGVKSSFAGPDSYFDPLVKELRVVEAKGRNLIVEGYYWEADYYNTYGQRCAKDIPIPKKPSNFDIAYTAVGTEGPPPLYVTLSGPSTVNSGQTATWTASISGGSGSTSYDWEYRPAGSSSWQNKNCSSSSCSHTFHNYSDQVQHGGIRVTVTKGSENDDASTLVSVSPDCEDNVICPPSAKAKGAGFLALQDFGAEGHAETAEIRWATVGTASPTQYTIQHRADSTADWSDLGTVDPADSIQVDTTEATVYRFQTDELDVGAHQFRLSVETGKRQGHSSEVVTIAIEMDDPYKLETYPNPVRDRATIGLAVKERQEVEVQVYDLLGRRVATLHDGPLPAQETRRLPLRASETGLTSGPYFVRAVGEDFVATQKLTVVR